MKLQKLSDARNYNNWGKNNFILFITCIFSRSHISLIKKFTLIILYYTTQFTIKLHEFV
jgi:hypothetical protein